jgi:hypothetical protein
MKRGLVLVVTVGVGSVAGPAPAQVSSTDAVGPAAAIAVLNAQRAAHGIPAGITENPAWSDACAKHARYVELNGRSQTNPHDEDPSLPGYTPEGQTAARSSVLGGVFDESGRNPYEFAPIHLMQLLGPGLVETGYAPGCMWTWPGYTRPAPTAPALFTYPGPGTTIYPAMTAREAPFTPGEKIGIPDGTETGPHLYVFAFGESVRCVRLTSANVTGPAGPVDIRSVDNTTDAVGEYLPAGGILIPTSPLQPSSEYRATAQGYGCGAEDGGVLQWDWTFHTEAAPVPAEPEPEVAPDPELDLRAIRRWSRLWVDVNPNGGGNYHVTILRYAKNRWVQKRSVRTRGAKHRARLNMPAGWYIARISVPGGEVYSDRVRLLR